MSAGPRVFLTGASSGIGEALARHYASRGATLGLVARRVEALRRVQASLPPSSHAQIHACDVRDAAAMRQAAAEFIKCEGVPEIVIANAGVSHGTRTELAEDLAAFREIMDTNVLGVVNTFQPFVAPMRMRGSGSLVGIASVAGFRGLPGSSAYSASKAAAIRYLEALRVELRSSGIRVTTLCPGYVATPMTARNPYPMPFLLEVDDAARRFARAIDARKACAVIPWQMAIVARLMAVLPDALYDRLASRAGRKPRKSAASPPASR